MQFGSGRSKKSPRKPWRSSAVGAAHGHEKPDDRFRPSRPWRRSILARVAPRPLSEHLFYVVITTRSSSAAFPVLVSRKSGPQKGLQGNDAASPPPEGGGRAGRRTPHSPAVTALADPLCAPGPNRRHPAHAAGRGSAAANGPPGLVGKTSFRPSCGPDWPKSPTRRWPPLCQQAACYCISRTVDTAHIMGRQRTRDIQFTQQTAERGDSARLHASQHGPTVTRR